MSLTVAQKNLISSQWDEVSLHSEAAAKLFYDRLFETYPNVKTLFKTDDMVAQGIYQVYCTVKLIYLFKDVN